MRQREVETQIATFKILCRVPRRVKPKLRKTLFFENDYFKDPSSLLPFEISSSNFIQFLSYSKYISVHSKKGRNLRYVFFFSLHPDDYSFRWTSHKFSTNILCEFSNSKSLTGPTTILFDIFIYNFIQFFFRILSPSFKIFALLEKRHNNTRLLWWWIYLNFL